jgi:hypothetical protein
MKREKKKLRRELEAYFEKSLIIEKPELLAVDYGYCATQTHASNAAYNTMVYERTMMTRDFKKAKELNNER